MRHDQADSKGAGEEGQLLSAKMEAVACLAVGVAHEFNNMLTVIRGVGEIVLSELGEDDPLRADTLKMISVDLAIHLHAVDLYLLADVA